MARTVWWTQHDLVLVGRETRSVAVVYALLAAGAKVDEPNQAGMTPLMYASGWHHELTQRVLLKSGASVHARDKAGRTALTWGARDGADSDIVKNLLKAGARVGLTEAMLIKDWVRAIKLLEKGADVRVPGPWNETTLAIAAERGCPGMVEALLARGLSPNTKDDDGYTPLALGAVGRPQTAIPSGVQSYPDAKPEHPRVEIVRALLKAGAQVNVGRDGTFGTAYDLANWAGNREVMALLLRHGAKTRAFQD